MTTSALPCLALAVLVLAGCATSPSGTSAPPPELTSKEVIARAVEAMGGAEAVDGVSTLRLAGRSIRTLPGGRTDEGPVHSVVVFPDRFRQEIQGRVGPLSTMLTPDGAFLVAVGMMLPLPEEQRSWMAASLRRNPVRLLQLRDDPAFDLGLTPTAVSDDEIVLEAALEGEWLVLAFDRESGRLARVAVPQATVPETGTGEYTVAFADWRELEGGLVYPFATEASFEGNVVFRTLLEAVEVNVEVSDELFTPATSVAGPGPGEDPPTP